MNSTHRATIVTDLGFGDSGKGSMVDYLARTLGTSLVIRFNGGGQAAHNVVTPDGRHHRFSQFGSASFLPGVQTHLSRFMLVNPLGLTREAGELHTEGVSDLYGRLTIDREALITTPYHQAANRLRELARGTGRHGSCGHGIGETMADSLDWPVEALRAGDLETRATVVRKLELVRERKLVQLAAVSEQLAGNPAAARDLETLHDPAASEAVATFYRQFAEHVAIVDTDHLNRLLACAEHTVFEGAQGVLLDEWRGFHPYTTWSTTTFANADQLLAEADFSGEVTHLGLLRAYFTRHGAGPFVTEDPVLTGLVPDYHNTDDVWQGQFRVGHFDLVAARYALEVAGVTDALAISCLDRLSEIPRPWQVATGYRFGGRLINRLVPSRFTDLDHQQQLTNQLFSSTPVYEPVPGTVVDYLNYLEDQLGVPIRVTSHGVRSTDKCTRTLVST